MKVVDMFGSGLPVCAIAFPTLPELVRHGENGFIFQTPLELKDRLFDLLIAEGHERVLEGLRKVGSFLLYVLSILCVCIQYLIISHLNCRC